MWLYCSTTKSNLWTFTALDDEIWEFLKLCCCSTKKISPWKTQKSDFPSSISLFLLLCDELYRYQKENKLLHQGGQVCMLWKISFLPAFSQRNSKISEMKPSKSKNKCRFLSFGMRQVCRGNPSCSLFPQRHTGNQPVITLLSAGANYKAGGEVGGGSTAWFLVSSATACWSPCWALLLPPICLSFPAPSTFISFHVSSISPSLLLSPHRSSLPSFSPYFVFLQIESHFGCSFPNFFPLSCSSSCHSILRL